MQRKKKERERARKGKEGNNGGNEVGLGTEMWVEVWYIKRRTARVGGSVS